MTILAFGYFTNIEDITLDWMRDQHYGKYEYQTHKDRLIKEFKEGRGYWYLNQHRFKNSFLDKVVGDETNNYYAFILAKEQMIAWEQTLKKYNLKQYIIYDSGMVINNNYPTDGPRIQCFILKFPENYKAEINEI